jgi:plasmid stability protein
MTLCIKNTPETLVERLKARARQNHRSLQGEVKVILGEAVEEGGLTPGALLSQVRGLGLHTPASAVKMIREDRRAR